MSMLEGKAAVVTGASKGIGAGVAKALASAGAAVAVNYASSKADADRVVADIERAGGRAVAIHADLSKADDVRRLFDSAIAAFDRLDILVNNAGVYKFAALEEVEEAEYRRQFDVNVWGPILASREALKHFGPNGGSIINVSSVASESAPPGSVIYSATKGAVDTVTRVLAKELAGRRIRVNTIAPGAVETEGVHAQGFIGTDFMNKIVADTPLGRMGQPADIAGLAVFLASDASGWITGERITASGGLR